MDHQRPTACGIRGQQLVVDTNPAAEVRRSRFSRQKIVGAAFDAIAVVLDRFDDAADARGRFEAELTVPLQVDVGDYRVVATTPGAGACGASR